MSGTESLISELEPEFEDVVIVIHIIYYGVYYGVFTLAVLFVLFFLM